ncbi:hypothetical protein EUGRSUZ_K01703 [Eucalyptus grandis]|uniref:Uncharacterized protein n=2 Tax=Eucalyptus grandis TaxID=71139 RepID=A0ACC3IUR5_EUCGR|nr:hypothetical protein EUGRSUZ_K01703 [Eucalyptus grandis]
MGVSWKVGWGLGRWLTCLRTDSTPGLTCTIVESTKIRIEPIDCHWSPALINSGNSLYALDRMITAVG